MERTVVEDPMAHDAVVRADDEGAFDAFVVARGDALWRSAWLLTTDHQLAEDLVQTALAKSWRAWSRVGPDGFEAYVRRVMYTTYVSWWRRKWRAERPTEHLPERAAASEDRDARNDLVSALGRLPRGQRAVVVLRYFEDLTEQQTAAALGIGVGTVKSQCSRALTTLRSSPHLRREEPGDE
ncbi:SigE family RNA polymerase sigma factor [Nocardioides sp. WV_118_6]|uniref:SigE family RNA polymerase sigma factor n=1 Tax=Pimelobacter TaxID=2044 RepID=UPI00207BC972|nr:MULTISPECIES: SigE family RNA polymerase sigma factor [Pimelobacter]UUW92281.1 SigE family RNA polymerase sigma factor [Pimelobacter simplex]UUW96108.1 SigE family RNA polymerase sigma factor [Pimelobacter simplex]